MRIALFCHKFWPAVGGLCTYTGRLSEYLAAHGHDVCIFTTRIPATTPARETIAPRLIVNRFTPRLANHPPFHFTPALLGRSFSRDLRQADVIHTVGYYFFVSVFGHRVAKAFGIPHVSTPVYTLNPSSWQRNLFDSAMGRSLVRRADYVIPQSGHEVELLRQARFDLPTHAVIPFGVDAELFARDYDVADLRQRHGIADAEQVLLFVGKIMSPKGAFDCLEVTARLRNAGRRVRLIMIGEVHPREVELFAARVGQLGLRDVVTLTGSMTDRVEIARYYQLSSAVLFPSQYEQFGIVAVEAVASGRPLLGTPVGIMQSLVPDLDSGRLHRFGDLDGFEQNLTAVLDDPRYRENAVRHRQDVLAGYSWQRIAAQTERVLTSAAERDR